MSTNSDLIKVFSVYIEAPAERVWEALTTSEGNNAWGYGGDVDIDLTPGGAYVNHTTAAMREMGMGDVAISGTVVAADPPHRLELTWSPAWHPEYEPTTLVWELTEYDGGLTRVVLTHDLTAAPALAAEVAGGNDPGAGGGGWPWCLSGLKTWVETGKAMVGSGG